MKVKYSQLAMFAALLVYLDIVTASLEAQIFKRTIIIFITGVLLSAFVSIKAPKNVHWNHITYGMLAIIMGFIIVGAIRRETLDNKYLIYLLIILFMMLTRKFLDINQYTLKLFLVTSFIFALATIWLSIDKRTYLGVIVPLYPGTSERLIQLYNNGFNAGLTSHYSTNGMLLANGMLIAFSGLFACAYKKQKRRWWVVIMIFLIALFLTGKRAHLLFSTAAVLLGFLLSKKEKISPRVFRLIACVTVLAILLYIGSMVNPTVMNFLGRFQNMSQDENVISRFRFWNLAVSQFVQNPVFGIGWGAVYGLAGSSLNYFANTHNVYLQILCETGIVGMVFFAFMFISNLYWAIKRLRAIVTGKICVNNTWLMLSIFGVMYQIYFLLYCFTGNPLYDGYTYVPYFIACIVSTMPKENIAIKQSAMN